MRLWILLLAGCTSAPVMAPPPVTPDKDAGAADVTVAADTGSTMMTPDSGTMMMPPDSGPPPTGADPFAAQPDESEGLVNVSADLNALLENGTLAGACADYEADKTDRRKMLLCGKQMFFYETFGTGGVPAVLIDFLTANFPNDVGPGFEQMGMVLDPSSAENRPLGLAQGVPQDGIDMVVFTCASCHFAQLPDGRYAVGAPNHRYEYGKQILAINLVPSSVAPGFDPAEHDPRALAAVQPMLDILANDRGMRLRLLGDLLPLLGVERPEFTLQHEQQYASWPAGTMDFMIVPLPIDDGVHTVSKISALWGIPRPEEEAAANMPHAMLAWTGGTTSLDQFLEGFVVIGGGPGGDWPPERIEPLREYIYSLRAPAPATTSEAGKPIFQEKCLSCHGGPRGGGDRIYTFEEMGTDDAMKMWADPELDGSYCCGLSDDGTIATHGIKSPRLTGTWTFEKFLHNGSVDGLDTLFCLDGPRPPNADHAMGSQGHEDLCALTREEKLALIDYLSSI